MKRRTSTEEVAMTDLAAVLAAIGDPDLIARFLVDLCTPAEVEAMVDRWAVVPLLAGGNSYRAIHQETGVSVTTIGRVARCLEHGTGGYAAGLAHRQPSA